MLLPPADGRSSEQIWVFSGNADEPRVGGARFDQLLVYWVDPGTLKPLDDQGNIRGREYGRHG